MKERFIPDNVGKDAPQPFEVQGLVWLARIACREKNNIQGIRIDSARSSA